MNNKEFLDYINKTDYIYASNDVHEKFYELSQNAIKHTMEINTKYHNTGTIS